MLTNTPYEDLYVMHENNSLSHHFPAFAVLLVCWFVMCDVLKI